MKKIVLLLLSITVLSCSKDKPPSGRYYATFDYSDQNADKSTYLDITETSKDRFFVNQTDTIYKDGHKVNGRLSLFYNSSFYIKGKWHKKIFNSTYYIEGDFTEQAYYHGGYNTFSGTFTIKSDF